MSPPLAWLLVAFVTAPNGSITSTFVPGIESAEACHHLAVNLNVPNHQCISYPMAATGKIVEPDAAEWQALEVEAKAAGALNAVKNCEAEGIWYHCQSSRWDNPADVPINAAAERSYLARPIVRVAQAAPVPRQKPGYGTLFGYVPNDSRAAPVNEFLNNLRGAIFCGLVLPGFCRPL
jgi:hypothetical protein